MGVRGGPWYPQEQMSRRFAGLLYNILELYIDDLVVYAQTFAELLERLRKTFQRTREKNLALNPKKCYFGLRIVEYVGHTIDKGGFSFSLKKL